MTNEKRLIDANELKKKQVNVCFDDDSESDGFGIVYVRHIDEAPTVDAVEVVHGEWIGTQYDGYADGFPVYDLWECSNCREEYESEGDPPPFNYCPNCGAKMDGERKVNDLWRA